MTMITTEYRVRYVLRDGTERLTIPLGDHETADRWAKGIARGVDVVHVEVVECAPEERSQVVHRVL